MRRTAVFLSVLALLCAGAQAQQLSADAVELAKVKIPEAQKSHELCPVTLKPADPKVPTWEHEGVTYGGCTADCEAEFNTKPAEYAEQAAKQRWENNFIAAMSTIWCPVTDEIGPGNMTQWEKLGLTWESCCQFCNETVRDDMFPRALERLKKRAAESYELTGGKYVEGASSPVEGAIDFNAISDGAVSPEAGGLMAAAATPQPTPAWLEGKDLKPTYTEGVAVIIENRCLECHRQGSVAPMSFTSYNDIRRYADKLKAVLEDGSMPPWPADPAVGAFANSKRLTPEEKDLLLRWIEERFPRGDGEYVPGARWATEWTIGEPDHVFAMEEYEIPADATEHIYEFTIETDFPEDRWIVAAEAMPGDPFLVRSIEALPLGEYHSANSYEFMPNNTGRKLEAGESVNVRIHYTKEEGWEEYDESRFAVKFADEAATIEKQLLVDRMANNDFTIPAGEANAEVSAEFSFPADGQIVSLTPVLRERGTSVKYVAVLPDGTEKELLSIPEWNMKWQFTYELAEPMPAPKGTVVRVTATYDNSAGNALNPNPDVDVHAGPEGEILEGRIAYVLD